MVNLVAYMPIIGPLIGGFFAGIVATGIQRAITYREDRKLFVERMEDAYRLSQELYEGHHGEILKARSVGNKTSEQWFDNRRHPGKQMSDIKMIVSGYARHLQRDMVPLDQGHSALKECFLSIDRAIQSGDTPLDACRRQDAVFDESLVLLGTGVNAIKNGTSQEIYRRFRRFGWWLA